jgi:protein-L-isoaspartate(D-aspartate) O-methyltransferase
MIDTQLLKRGIRDARVLEAMAKVPRHEFVEDSQKNSAYDDDPLPIGCGQTISQPYIVAYMSEALQIEPQDRVLEIGTGSGYQTAILAELALEVYTVEIVAPLLESASGRLRRLGYTGIHYKEGSGAEGWPEKSPFQKIIVTAAAEKIPHALADQLSTGGRMIFPLGKPKEVQDLMLGIKTPQQMDYKQLMQVRFVPLVQN